MKTLLKLTLLTCLSILLSACGSDIDSDSDNDSNTPSFESTLEPSVYKNGVWDLSNITIYYNIYEPESAIWIERTLKTDASTLTILDNALEGTTTILSMEDSAETITTPGASIDGFIVGETLSIKGHIDGSTMALVMTSESGMTASLIGAPYDGGITENDSKQWVALDYWDGVGAVSIEGSVPGNDSYVESPTYNDAIPSTLIPSAIEVPLGSGDSIYVNGNYAGGGGTYMAIFDEMTGWGYSSIDYDLNVTVSGNTISGTMTLTDLGEYPDLEGYGVNDVFEVNGTITGPVVYITCTNASNPSFSWRHIWGASEISGQSELIGEFTEIKAYYGVTYRTENTFGGENYIYVNLQVTE
jgi:hypothetical protein